ncbi:hypothetical protein [Paenibacillus chitinolyticus]|uniref:hypothetical protein n=1 Tax=Paenibacillus chitinolyticus TaxID=79263 RepID=UPI00366E7128
MSGNVERIYPESKTGVINWIEQNFHDIDEFICIFQMKDGTTTFVYDTYTYRGALGTLEMAKESLSALARNDEFIPKAR